MNSCTSIDSVAIFALLFLFSALVAQGNSQDAPVAPSNEKVLADGSVSVEQLRTWYLQLASSSYHQRFAARVKLEQAGLAARPVLLEGIQSDRLDVRVTCQRLLAELAGSERDAELDRLQFAYQPGHVYELPGWERYRRVGGDSAAHRSMYVQLVKRHAQGLRWIDTLPRAAQGASEEIATIPETLGLDAQRLADGDAVDWTFLLLAACQSQVKNTPTLMSQVYGGLLDARVSQQILMEESHGPLKSLIHSWVAAQDDPLPRRSLVQVCLRYGLYDEATSLALKILRQRGAPSATQYALLALSRSPLDPAGEQRLLESLEDRRICHTWQVVSSGPHTLRAEVRDTALVLLLRNRGLDPRAFGFADLQADPDTIFRDFTIGFATDSAREAAFQNGLAALNKKVPGTFLVE